MEPIFVTGTRIFGPFEYDKFVTSIEKPYLKTIFDVAFWTGMRYVEIQRLHDNPDWWMRSRKTIHLPEEANKKAKRKQLERYIHPIPPQIENVLDYFFMGKRPPSPTAWNTNLKRWGEKAGFDPSGISAKTTRKSIESWMVAIDLPITQVCLRHGHDQLTAMNHYLGLPFTDEEKHEIKKRLAWF